MENNNWIVVAGCVGYSDDSTNLVTLICSNISEVKDLALQFITVFPDDLQIHKDEIATWTDTGLLEEYSLYHSDDDNFIFKATKVAKAKSAYARFTGLVEQYVIQDDEDEES